MPSSTDADAVLRLSKPTRARRIQTKNLARLVHGREIRHVMIDGIVHIPVAVRVVTVLGCG
ncbi:MAG: hypothetical protein ACRD0G_04595 [Acidimicrobiales bacterium]